MAGTTKRERERERRSKVPGSWCERLWKREVNSTRDGNEREKFERKNGGSSGEKAWDSGNTVFNLQQSTMRERERERETGLMRFREWNHTRSVFTNLLVRGLQ